MLTFVSDRHAFCCHFKHMKRGTLEQRPEYLIRRLTQEEAAAESATDSRARQSHLEMARRYRDACNEAETEDAGIRIDRVQGPAGNSNGRI